MAGIFGVNTQLFSTSETKDDNDSSSGYDSNTAKVTAGIPKIDVLFGSNSGVMTGYYAGLEFLDKKK